MKTIFHALGGAVLLAGLLLGGFAAAQTQQPAGDSAQEPATSQPDNTKMNKRDRNTNEPTADQQKNNRSDLDMTKEIRRAIENDKSLSTYAHNVKVVTQNGMVTLKGPVRSEEEKKAVESKAAQVAGEQNVTSQLEIKAEK